MSIQDFLFDLPNNQRYVQPAVFLVALFFSFLITPLIRDRALALGLVEPGSSDSDGGEGIGSGRTEPGRMKLHEHAVPRLGGVAILISIIITTAIYLAIYGRYTPRGIPSYELEAIAAGGLIIFVIGLLDDIKPLHPLTKLSGQVLAASVAWLMNIRIEFLANPIHYIDHARASSFDLDPWISYLATVIFLVAISNAINLIDGIDGLAVGVCIIASIASWVIAKSPALNQPAGAMLAATMAGACLGFLRYNFNPARIFLGDNGSYLLGFILGCISCIGLVKKVTVVVISPILILILLVPICDICFAVLRRAINKQAIMRPDLGHLHHKLMELGLSQKQVNYLLYGITFLGGLIGTLFLGYEIALEFLIISSIVLLLWLAFAFVFNRKHQKI